MTSLVSTKARIDLTRKTQVAVQRNANVFIWLPSHCIGCFNDAEIGPVTAKTLLRWISSSTRPPLRSEETALKLVIQCVDLKPNNVNIREGPIRCRPILPSNGRELVDDDEVKEGDCVIFFRDASGNNLQSTNEHSDLYDRFWYFRSEPSFADKDMTLVGSEGTLPDGDIIRNALKLSHNQARCVVTGNQDINAQGGGQNEHINWIYPPIWVGGHVGPQSEKLLDWTQQGFRNEHNLIALCDEMYRDFQKNTLAIDLDNDPEFRGGKIRTFSPALGNRGLPESPRVPIEDEMTRGFLRVHFQHCLFVNIFGGDVQYDAEWNDNQVELMKTELARFRASTGKEFPESGKWIGALGDAIKEWELEWSLVEDESE
ncbi:hypothetical protein BD310DRAFT_969742 [Dichomitus squalens]|uniref:Uncharacterized protein n=1 Tax=Dichomitus squalens TaxID=114155 RepID=A0A4Q9PK52_9APHY|nr:hypothetical protein BD310DRAFT_969742 [Dichomitus squalens]